MPKSASLPRLAATATVALVAAASAQAQLTPDREYYGVNRSIPMTVAVPGAESGEVEIALLEPVTARVVEKRPAAKGGVDLAGLFPILWTSAEPKTMYAQLIVGGKKIGPAVVLQPLATPSTAVRGESGVRFNPPQAQVYSGLRAWTDQNIVFDTTAGEIEIALRPDQAPNTVHHIVDLVEGGFYTDIAVHRIVANAGGNGNPFVVQFGDPTAQGSGGPGLQIDLEPSTLPHDFGVISMARTADPNTNGSQVFLCLSREGTKFLDTQYTSFGQMVRGDQALLALERTPADPTSGRPKTPPIIKSARMVPAPPYGEGPAPLKRPGPAPVER
jgi:peptidyl-prolyl cis-trans isomerase B (cyclophilin B)